MLVCAVATCAAFICHFVSFLSLEVYIEQEGRSRIIPEPATIIFVAVRHPPRPLREDPLASNTDPARTHPVLLQSLPFSCGQDKSGAIAEYNPDHNHEAGHGNCGGAFRRRTCFRFRSSDPCRIRIHLLLPRGVSEQQQLRFAHASTERRGATHRGGGAADGPEADVAVRYRRRLWRDFVFGETFAFLRGHCRC